MLEKCINEKECTSIFYNKIGKRVLDISIALPSIVLLLPLFLIVGLIIKMESKGPVFFRQNRVGRAGHDFTIFKFRTMVNHADQLGPKSTQKGDCRITAVGKVLRKYSIDELPQLINVLIGDMSLVGYRPGVRENYTEELLKSELFLLKPGITGYAQVNGRSSLTSAERRRWELIYAETVSFITDIKIILRTIMMVIRTKNTN